MRVADACLYTAMRAFIRGDQLLRGLGRDPPEFDPDLLLGNARRHTGLTDVGVQSLFGPMERLVEALEREAQLTPLGRVMAHRHLVSLLETALLLQRDRSSAVGDQRITAPVFIVGLPRTGTTLLHNLLSQDPATARSAMQDYLAANPRDARGVHRYSLPAFGLDARQETQRFSRYCERFDIEREADPRISGHHPEVGG